MFKKKKNIIIITGFILLFFLYNFLNLINPRFFNSPDENANFVFISNFAQNNSLIIPLTKDYEIFNEFIHPRSTFVIEKGGQDILPVGFWGIIIFYGAFAKIFGDYLLLFLTSILTILAGLAFYKIIEKIWNKNIAWFSTILFYIHPAVFYYTSRSFFPNMPFIDLLIISLYFLLTKPFSKKYQKLFVDDIIGFVFLLSALLVRPSEIVWLFISGLIILFSYKKEISNKSLVRFSIISFLFFLFYLIINTFLYNNSAPTYISSNSLDLDSKLNYIFPFGINLNLILSTGYFYFVKLFLPFVFLALLGIFVFLFDWQKNKNINKEQKIYFSLFIFISLFLFVYYGSYKTEMYYQKTIGVAYDRYWLLIFIMSLPFIAYFFDYFKRKLNYKKDYFIYSFIFILFLFSFKLTFTSLNGIFFINNQLQYQKEVREDVLNKYGNDVIILTDSEDKFFWPEIEVIVRFFDPNVAKNSYKMLENNYELYYFTHNDEKRFFQARDYLEIYNLEIVKEKVYKEHTLFKLKIKN
ncbi:MAG: hypothetical protein WC414_00105 [Patescibacteria group bacterium]